MTVYDPPTYRLVLDGETAESKHLAALLAEFHGRSYITLWAIASEGRAYHFPGGRGSVLVREVRDGEGTDIGWVRSERVGFGDPPPQRLLRHSRTLTIDYDRGEVRYFDANCQMGNVWPLAASEAVAR